MDKLHDGVLIVRLDEVLGKQLPGIGVASGRVLVRTRRRSPPIGGLGVNLQTRKAAVGFVELATTNWLIAQIVTNRRKQLSGKR